MDLTFEAFLRTWPEYENTLSLDALRVHEYSRLDEQNHVYLDYTGGGLYAIEQLDQHMALLRDNVFGNPHSLNPTSMAATHLIERTRKNVLEYFNADPDEYEVIFTANASNSLKLIGEAYPFSEDSCYLLAFDNHNSVNGIREFARSRGAQITYIPLIMPLMNLDVVTMENCLAKANPEAHNLLAYPAQSNFSGVQHPLDWIETAQAAGWDVLLDVAAFVPTNPLDLSHHHPEFVVLSFYKMFGYPTGIGALVARKQALMKLQRPWFAGGTITVASVQGDAHYYAEGAAAFEDGTVNYLMLPAVEIGLEFMQKVGVNAIHERVRTLTGWLLQQLPQLTHSNGKPLVQIYGPLDTNSRGGTIALNFYDPDGQCIDHREVESCATRQNISLRTGCFCNPGGGEIALNIKRDELISCFQHVPPREGLSFEKFQICIDHNCGGAVRISLGIASNFDDVLALVKFAQTFIDQPSTCTLRG